MRTIDMIITKVNTKYGAPIGRLNVGKAPIAVTSGKNGRITKKHNKHMRVYDCVVPMIGAYDRGGAYWGHGPQLRVQYNKNLSYIKFYRKGDTDIIKGTDWTPNQ